eukprot:TRINITY_DN12151_c0_g1_i1.p1 TRINITY_DN12151_c0_g1~~TRINITY_DN12151_c0_g1_i1.p1  ORF type:complete len:166 (-),score=24.98 TRINITY_DN12151_c0_g1_i1:40-537(-)
MSNRVQVGDTIPSVDLRIWEDNNMVVVNTHEYFADKTVVLFAVPGAFTSTCTSTHCPSYVNHAIALKEAGVDLIACTSVNDIFVLNAWAASMEGASDNIVMMSDGSADLAKALGMEKDLSSYGFGIRSQRYAMVLKNLKVVFLGVDESGYGQSSAESALEYFTKL